MQHNCSDGGVWPACYGRRRNDLPRLILFFVAAKENSSACSGRSSDDLPRPILTFVAAKKNGRLQLSLWHRPTASDSNLRRRKEEWFRLQKLFRQRRMAACRSRFGKEEWFRLPLPQQCSGPIFLKYT